MIAYNVKNVSTHVYTTFDDKGKKYMIKSRFFLDSKYNNAIAEFLMKLKSMGVIYGELRENEDANPIDISLSRVSHYIKKIEKPVAEIRKLKLQKLKGVDISSDIFNYQFEIEVLDSHNGKLLKELMNEGFPIKTVLRCGNVGKSIKIFTVDVNCYYSEKEERKMKLEKLDYNDYVAENLDKSISYSEYIAENLDKCIDYNDYIAENLDKCISYSEYIAENLYGRPKPTLKEIRKKKLEKLREISLQSE